jgi:3,4-dihydroxy 2-butanone 4-phosphate synthase/GTP cyclohydrolase II
MEGWSVLRRESARIPTDAGEFALFLYTNNHDDKEHLALVMGEIEGQIDVPVRIHSECFTGDVIGSRRCDCGEQLHRAMTLIGDAGRGVVIYLRQEGRGIGLLEKLRAYNLQDQGYDTVDANLLLGHQADERDYTVAAEILGDLKVKSILLLTNNPTKMTALSDLGIVVSARIPLQINANPDNFAYLQAKVQRMNHWIDLDRRTDSTPPPIPPSFQP